MEVMQSSEKADHDLILAALRGDHEAFAVIVERYVSSIYKFSYRYVRNGPDAEDIAQETFLRAWKSLKKFDQSKNFKTWIFAIAKNASLDLLKKKKPMPFSRIAEEDDAVEAVLAPYVAVPDTSETAFDQGLLKKDFDAVLAKLPIHYRDIMVLRYADNLKFREIAERLHEPLDTVKSRHRRGLALLRNIADAGDFAVNH
ncbi:MAG: sigma-70 family RNA polymerase sigma factor [Minisyncoccia bacterium]|jgi:RNA polymerase sigma-70 factor (ECF subfamily)